jgi:hypothetical protein
LVNYYGVTTSLLVGTCSAIFPLIMGNKKIAKHVRCLAFSF